jgi:NTP pyrophosphatase (non-canonical NTP hydrolase)
MDINDYGQFTTDMWFSGKRPDGPPMFTPDQERELAILGFGLAGEGGEVLEHLKKALRDNHLDRDELKKELGDAVFYWTRVCIFFGFNPSEVLDANVTKLTSRRDRGVLRGDGDNR